MIAPFTHYYILKFALRRPELAALGFFKLAMVEILGKKKSRAYYELEPPSFLFINSGIAVITPTKSSIATPIAMTALLRAVCPGLRAKKPKRIKPTPATAAIKERFFIN